MNVVDSCGWLEYFADGPNADFFAPIIEKTSELVVPSISIFEVFKKVLHEKSEDEALQSVALMQQGQVIDLNSMLAISAAKISSDLKLPLADAVILATAYYHQAPLWTQDADFEGVRGVNFKPKKK